LKICNNMADDHLEHIRLRADIKHHRQVRYNIVDALDVVGQIIALAGDVSYNTGYVALAKSLRCVVWPHRFRLDMPACYDGSSDPIGFLRSYAIVIQVTGGASHVMARWLPMVVKGVAREWLMGLRPNPSRHGGTSASASSIISLFLMPCRRPRKH
jgi:hypothetical protein